MKPVGIFYATREGQTARIAEYITERLSKRGVPARILNLVHPDVLNCNDYSAMILATSVHAGRHEAEMIRFVKRHRAELDSLPHAFLSVTLSEAGFERPDATPAERDRFLAGCK